MDSPANIVLLHIGTNDISERQTASEIALEVDGIIDEIDRYEADYEEEVTVLLALIINRSDPTSALGKVSS